MRAVIELITVGGPLRRVYLVLLILVLGLLPAAAASAAEPEPATDYAFAGSLFGLSAGQGNTLLVADAGAGVVAIRGGHGVLLAELPGIADVAPAARGAMFAVTGGPDAKLYRVTPDGKSVAIADLGAYETNVNPVPPEVNPNPFDVVALSGGRALVADAGGNDLLIVDLAGNIDWVATLPDEVVSSAHVKALIGCPNPVSPDFAFVCDLPGQMPAQPVATSIAIGPDGAYYMGELKGFPAPTGESKIWRIERGARHAQCGTSPKCRVVADGFTSIIDLNFGIDGQLYVTEFDENTFAAVELGLPGLMAGGTVNKCDPTTWSCTEVATGLTMPTATAMDRRGNLYATVSALIPGQATVVRLK